MHHEAGRQNHNQHQYATETGSLGACCVGELFKAALVHVASGRALRLFSREQDLLHCVQRAGGWGEGFHPPSSVPLAPQGRRCVAYRYS